MVATHPAGVGVGLQLMQLRVAVWGTRTLPVPPMLEPLPSSKHPLRDFG